MVNCDVEVTRSLNMVLLAMCEGLKLTEAVSVAKPPTNAPCAEYVKRVLDEILGQGVSGEGSVVNNYMLYINRRPLSDEFKNSLAAILDSVRKRDFNNARNIIGRLMCSITDVYERAILIDLVRLLSRNIAHETVKDVECRLKLLLSP